MCVDLFSIGNFTIHGYGLMIGIGFMLAALMGCRRAKARGLSDDIFLTMAMCVLIFGFMGGKLLFIIVEYKDFFADPLGALGSSGFVVYGGIISGVLAAAIYCRIKKASIISYIDILAPSAALNQAFGRIGCLMAGCCYGRETDSAIGIVFPEGCLAPAGVKLLPTQIMMSVADFIHVAILLVIAKKCKYRGQTMSAYLLFYSIGRFAIEFFRNDYRGSVGFLSTSQFISLFIFVLSLVSFFIMGKLKLEPDKIKDIVAEEE